MADAEQTYREVMTKEPPSASTPFEVATREWRRAAAATPWEVPPVMPVHIWEPSK